MVPIPTPAEQTSLLTLFSTLISSLEAHALFTPPKPHPAFFHTWDFIQRTNYILQNLEAIRTGTPVSYPEQIPKNPEAKDDEERARMSFADVVTRSITIHTILEDPKLLDKLGLPNDGVDFGEEVRGASGKLVDGLLGVQEDEDEDEHEAQDQAQA